MILSFNLSARQIILDNFNDGNSLTLYGKGEIGITADYDEGAGNTIIVKTFDSGNDHTTGYGYSLKLENYVIDVYGGIYLNVTMDEIEYPYIDGSVYKQLVFYLKASPASADWTLEIKDWDSDKPCGTKAVLPLGTISGNWTRFQFNLSGDTNITGNINITNIAGFVFINKINNSSGSLWIDDIIFDDLQSVEINVIDDNISVGFSDYKIDKDNLYTKITVSLVHEGTIEITVYNKEGVLVSTLNKGNIIYSGNNISHNFNWWGKDDKGNFLGNDIYFVKVKIESYNKGSRIIKPVGIFR